MFRYTINATNATYILNQSLASRDVAEQLCHLSGGHLVSYQSLAEHVEVEQYFLGKGWLLPSFHKMYWTGLNSSAAW